MGGIELRGAGCALWESSSQECSSAAREFAAAAAAARREAVAKGLLWTGLCPAKPSHHRRPSQPDGR